jgi:hypothetical protein
VDANAPGTVILEPSVVQDMSIYDAAKAAHQFNVLMAFADAVGLSDFVSGPGPMTILGAYNI